MCTDLSLQEYCLNQGQAISRLQTLREQDATVAQHLQVSGHVRVMIERSLNCAWQNQTIRNENASVRNLDLSSFLLEPSKNHFIPQSRCESDVVFQCNG